MLHILREDEAVRKTAYSWVEHCDWLPGIITGNTKPETCPAVARPVIRPCGTKAGRDYRRILDPLAGWLSLTPTAIPTSNTMVGYPTEEWANRLGLTTNVAVAVGADCHMGAVG